MLHISLSPETVFHFWGFPVTNSFLTVVIIGLVIVIGALLFKKSMNFSKPKRLQVALEMIVETMNEFFEGIAGDKEVARRFMPIVVTAFFFVLIPNWIGLLPGIGSIGFYEIAEGHKTFVPLFRTVYSDLNMTLALALFVITASHIFGIATLGVSKHAGKFFVFKGPIQFAVGILELIGEFTKIISFSFRLFGNVFAGEVLLVVMTFLVPYIAPLPFMGLEVFVGFIQALIFAVLAMMYLSTAVRSHDGH